MGPRTMTKWSPYFISAATLGLGWMLAVWAGPSAAGPAGASGPRSAPQQVSAPVSPGGNGSSQFETAGLAAYQRASERLAKQKAPAAVSETIFSELEKLTPREVGAAARAAFAAQDPQAALFLGYWAEVDPEGAVAWLDTVPENERRTASGPIVDLWVKRDPEAFLHWFETLPPGRQKSFFRTLGSPAFRQATKGTSPERVLKALLTAPEQPTYHTDIYAKIFDEWAQRDPAAAGAAALALTRAQDRTDAVGAVAAAWSAKDANAAFKWMQGLKDQELASATLKTYTEAMVDKDPKAALEMVADLPLTTANRDVMKSAVFKWTMRDPQAAIAWVADFKESAERRELLYYALQMLSSSKPELAMQLLPKYADQIDYAGAIFGGLADRVRATKGVAGLEELAKQVPADQVDWFWSSSLEHWVQQDSAGAQAWLGTLPEGPRRQGLTRTMATQMAARGLPSAIEWANNLPNTESNRPAVVQVARAAFRKGAGGVKIAKRVLEPAELSSTVEGWLYEALGDGMPPQALSNYLSRDEALTPEAKQRLNERAQKKNSQ